MCDEEKEEWEMKERDVFSLGLYLSEFIGIILILHKPKSEYSLNFVRFGLFVDCELQGPNSD